MNYGWSNYGKEKISKFFTSTISAFVFMYFTEKAPSPWEKKGKHFGCENYLKIERKSLLTVLVKDLNYSTNNSF